MMMWKKNKFGAIKQVYNSVTYDSKMEAKYAMELDLRLKCKDIKSWKRQEKIEIIYYNKHICNYFIDFVITHKDGSLEYVEIKGVPTPEWRLKWKLFEAVMTATEPKSILTIIRKV